MTVPLPLPVLAALALLGVALLLGLLCLWDMSRFLAGTPALRSDDDLRRYRRLVARQMYAAVAAIVLAVAAALVPAASLYLGWLAWADLWPVLALGLPFAVLGPCLLAVEARVKSVPAASGELAAERDRVVHTWKSRAFPDW